MIDTEWQSSLVVLFAEELRRKSNAHQTPAQKRRKFTKKEYESLVKKSEIFGKRATILRTKNGGRYFRFIKKWKLHIIKTFSKERSNSSNGSFCTGSGK